MPSFEPFPALRYDVGRVDLAAAICPPYDVIDDAEHSRLEAAGPYNAVRVELPWEHDGVGRYEKAAAVLRTWMADGTLVRDREPTFTLYRMRFADDAGRELQTLGVLGALGLEPPGEGEILPHERTTPKAKSDRLDLLRATRTNVSPIWGLSMAAGLTEAIVEETEREPDASAVDAAGITHEAWIVTDPVCAKAITSLVASAPVLVADGHHRFETAWAYREEAGDEGAAAVLAYIVELVDEQLHVRAIHRLLDGLPDGFDLPGALDAHFEREPLGAEVDAGILDRMTDASALALVTPEGAWLLRPRPDTDAQAEHDLDSSRLDVALATLPPHGLRYQHGWQESTDAVAAGAAQAAVLLRPATVNQIAATGHDRKRMPPKTTFFWPKPATGIVFRTLD